MAWLGYNVSRGETNVRLEEVQVKYLAWILDKWILIILFIHQKREEEKKSTKISIFITIILNPFGNKNKRHTEKIKTYSNGHAHRSQHYYMLKCQMTKLYGQRIFFWCFSVCPFPLSITYYSVFVLVLQHAFIWLKPHTCYEIATISKPNNWENAFDKEQTEVDSNLVVVVVVVVMFYWAKLEENTLFCIENAHDF